MRWVGVVLEGRRRRYRCLRMELFVMPAKTPVTANAVIWFKCRAITFQTLFALWAEEEEEAGRGGVGDTDGILMGGMATSGLGIHKGTGDGLDSRFHSCENNFTLFLHFCTNTLHTDN